jgi:hypothetical protein
MVSCRFFPWFFYGFPLNQSIVAAIEAPPTEQEMPSAELDAQTAVIFDKASFSWSIEAGVYWIVMAVFIWQLWLSYVKWFSCQL